MSLTYTAIVVLNAITRGMMSDRQYRADIPQRELQGDHNQGITIRPSGRRYVC